MKSPVHDQQTTAPYRDARVLVLGASGFIGRWLTRRLADAGADVVAGIRNVHALDDLADIVTISAIDLLDFASVSDLIVRTAPAVIFNLSGYGIDPRERDEDRARRINAELPPLLLQGMQRAKLPAWRGQRVIHAGSALEYGTCGGDLAEDSDEQPTTLYGLTKLAGALALREASMMTGLDSVTARLFTVYGPGERAGRLLPTLLEAADTGRTIDLTAGTQLRDFTYVEDVVEGLLRLGAVWTSSMGIVNVATGRLYSVRHFIETAAQILGIRSDNLKFGALPTRNEEMEHEPVTIGKLRELTAWMPPTTLEQGIRRTRELAAGSL